MKMRKWYLGIGVAVMCCFAPVRIHAMDPVTIALVAPAAIRLAEATHPYVMTGLAGGAQGLAKIGISAFKILYLPLGVCEATLGLPFGMLSTGVGHITEGAAAPFELVFHTILLPDRILGGQ